MKFYSELRPNLQDWLLQQPLFFTASAPLSGKHVNCSPKGLTSSSFAVLDPNHAAYIDATGSGSETISHIYERGNGRVTVMFCSFDTLPRILRLFCKGTVIEIDNPIFDATLERMGRKPLPGMRAIILLEIWKVSTSCGTGIPLVNGSRVQSTEEELENDDGASDALPIHTGATKLFRDRESMNHWAENMESKGKMHDWHKNYNADSLDGLAGLKLARRAKGQWMLGEDIKVNVRRILQQKDAVFSGIVVGVILVFFFRVLGLLPA